MRRLVAALVFGLACTSVACAAEVNDWSLPTPAGSAQPDLIRGDGEWLLSWIEKTSTGHRLRFAAQGPGGEWTTARTIAEGREWFVNWADTPHLARTADGTLWAHWLQKSAAATYAYDVMLVRSRDGGRRWTSPQRVHDDASGSEHGFVAMWPQARTALGIAWLDGRNTGGGEGHGGHDGHGGGMMSLRSAHFDATGDKSAEHELDASTCDCCQTDAALSADGAVLAYRDRTEAEIRDIYVTRQTARGWSTPVRVHADNWTMPACPVNGPAIAAHGRQVWAAWYTGAGNELSIRLARSADHGASFSPMQLIARGEAILGRVDVAADAGGAWLSWLEETPRGQPLWLARFDATGKELWRRQVATVQGRGRGTGLPRMALADNEVALVWTDIVDGSPRLRGLRVSD